MTNRARKTNPIPRGEPGNEPLRTAVLAGPGHTRIQQQAEPYGPPKLGELRRSSARPWFHQDHMQPRGRGERKNKQALFDHGADPDPKHRKRGNIETHPGIWPGTSKEIEPARRRRRNKATWRRALRRDRKHAVAHRERLAELEAEKS